MTKVRVLTEHCTLGAKGKTVVVPDGVNVRALERSGHVAVIPAEKPANPDAKPKTGRAPKPATTAPVGGES